MVLVDTDVLIWYMRGNENAYHTIEGLETFSISAVTYMELVQGMRNKKELNNLRVALRNWNAKVVYISHEISAKAMFLVEQHFLSHTLELADALIGASAVAHSLPLLTGNYNHYKVLRDVEIRNFLP